MYKKILIPLTLALVAALGFSGVASAASLVSTRVRLTGSIVSVIPAAQRFIIDTNTGTRVTIRVDDSTVYKGLAGSLSALKPAMDVVVVANQRQNGTYHAVSVNVLKLALKGDINGTVTAIGTRSFTILGEDGKTYTFHVNSNTIFRGLGVTSFSKLGAGMSVRVEYTDVKTGILRAVNVTVRAI
jgi:uncharacterized membrane protein YtjA (UPF0391 family)